MDTLVRAEIAEKLLNKNPAISKKNALMIIDTILNLMQDTLFKGGRVELRGFAVFEPRPRKSGFGRNIKTGDTVKIPDGMSIRFKPGKELKF